MIVEHVSGNKEKLNYRNIFAIGDIHGCLDSLQRLLDILPIDWEKDLVIFLGDYIDRGENPRGVIEKIIELKKNYPHRVITLKGNHEWMFERFLKGIDIEVFLYNGGGKTLKQYYNPQKNMLEIPEEHINFLKNLPLYFEIDEYLFVHAGINPEKELQYQKEEDLLWIRESFYLSDKSFSKVVVFGHTPFYEPFVKKDRIGIDTGCVYGGNLTAVMLPERRFFQVSCKRR